MKAIELKNNNYVCNRCGNKNQSLFAKTNCNYCGECVYCRNCIWLGKKTLCEDIDNGELEFLYEEPFLDMKYDLTILQKEASNKVKHSFNNGQDILVWAVCGAGKTEIVYEVILQCLSDKRSVCFVIPRVDVVREIKERIKKDFSVSVSALYGGSKEPRKATIFIMTTHQIMKYRNVFDLIIIDEVDAFPFSIDKSLTFGLHNAKKKNGVIVYLTATPPKHLLKNVSNKFIIPARYHRKKLDYPKFIKISDYRKTIPKTIYEILKSNDSYLIFMPNIKIMEKYKNLLNNPKILFVNSKDPLRQEKIELFKAKKVKFMFTTTILERGITFSGLNVCVVEANHRVFNKSSLIQICGRVGRKKECTKGNILFLYSKVNLSMVLCKLDIIKMNYLANKGGYIE